MKRIILILMIVIIVFSLFGCKSKPQAENDIASPLIEENSSSAGSEQIQSADAPEQDEQPPLEQAQQPEQEEQPSTEHEQPEKDISSQDEQQKLEDGSIKSEAEKTTEDEKYIPYDDGDITVYYPTDPFPHLDLSTSDVFIGKIIETKLIREPINVPGFLGFEKGAMVYKIQIEKVYRGTCVTENTAVYLYKSIEIVENMYSFNEDDYAHVNERYIFNGLVKPVNNEPVLIDSGFFTPKIEEDGKLTATNQTTKNGLEKISTLEAFDNSEELNKIWETDFKNLYDNFTRYIKTDKTEQELIAELKKAIIADSNFKMNLNVEQSSK